MHKTVHALDQLRFGAFANMRETRKTTYSLVCVYVCVCVCVCVCVYVDVQIPPPLAQGRLYQRLAYGPGGVISGVCVCVCVCAPFHETSQSFQQGAKDIAGCTCVHVSDHSTLCVFVNYRVLGGYHTALISH